MNYSIDKKSPSEMMDFVNLVGYGSVSFGL
jgi:hypothetical protein